MSTAYNSDLITLGGGQANPSVYPATARPVIGSVTIASNTSFATNDTIPLFYQNGPAGHIDAFWIDLPALDGGSGLTLSLLDSNTAPTTIVSASTTGQAGGFISTVNAVHGTVGNAVSYSAQSLIYLKAAHASTNTTGTVALTIYFIFLISQD